MAFAVGMDAFSVSLGMGIYKLRLKQIFIIGISVGIFHVVMPLIGVLAGHLLTDTFGKITGNIGGILLVILGLQMIIFCFRNDQQTFILPVGGGILIFSLLLSVDSFSAGISLGMFGVRAAITALCFGLVAVFLTWSGLLLGRKVQNLLGIYGELLGGIILIAFGLKLLLQFPY
ncbi:manganese efflux pump [Bacillus sp. FJAT-49711]|uniref:manganese efflux pump MntP n=1 Tax=Bacillus sp. FJAT-49711 TaxID=2833585 RepID=UPI001BC8CF94|nr:manganese efflux pump MntP family protein [Bacillus sp. FJAT-49711]MBS4218898.1 manganese efflux pump [Bacillus sp. FJAT-49711]